MSTAQDDWKVDVEPAEKVPIPSFIRLFVFNRILRPYITEKTSVDITSHDVIQSLLSECFEKKEDVTLAFAILSQLLTNDIKKYMNEYFNINLQPNIIEKIHNKLILTKFSQEYANVTTYTSSNNDNSVNDNNTLYQSLLFNTNDLMCCIFQYLRCYHIPSAQKTIGLFEYSLVNSHWLYHIFNPNSIDEINFSMLWKTSSKGAAVMNNVQARLWQRVMKARIVRYGASSGEKLSTDKSHDELISRVLMLGNVEKIISRVSAKNIMVLKALMQQSAKNIKYFDVIIRNGKPRLENVLSPLKLPNAEFILMKNKHFNIIWSNKCRKLKWFMLVDITKYWCNFVINNCDCSGIKYLICNDIGFNHNVNVDKNKVLSLLGKKFINIKKVDIILAIGEYTIENGLFWQGLSSMIEKNNAYVTLKLSKSSVIPELVTFIDKNNIQINEIESRLYSNVFVKYLCEIIVKCQHLECINITNRRQRYVMNDISFAFFVEKLGEIALGPLEFDENKNNSNDDDNNDSQENETTVLNTNTMSSNSNDGHGIRIIGVPELKTIEIVESITASSINVVNDLLSLEFILQRRIFILMVISIRMTDLSDDHEIEFLSKFNKLCQKIYKLMFNKQLAMKIELKFESLNLDGVTDGGCFKEMKQEYKSVFDENIVLSELKLPQEQCNKYCTSLDVPDISFTQNQANDQLKLCAVNARAKEQS